MDGSLSPLELPHPDGAAERALVLGSGCPERLVPARLQENGGGWDLVVVAPSATELGTRGWLEDAVRSAARELAADGLAYLLVPRRARSAARRAASKHGLSLESRFVHLPTLAETRHIVPLSYAPAAYALSSLIPGRASRRRLALAALGLPFGVDLLGYAAPAVGLAARRPGARPLYEWLFKLDDAPAAASGPVVSVSWQEPGGSFVLHRFASNEQLPSGVAKVRALARPGRSPADEAEILQRLAPRARSAGAEAPEPLVVDSSDGRSVVLETAVRGRSAAVLLGDAPGRLFEVHERVAEWLEAWSRSSAAMRPLTDDRLSTDVIDPAALLAPLVPEGPKYVSWLTSRCDELSGTAIPHVATHNDLTMSNVFVSDSGSLGVVDWEAGQEDGLPLVDFLYATADAAAAAHRYENRTQAFVDCFAHEGRHAASVRTLEASVAAALELSSALAELCFHACWLHHAANEHRRGGESGDRPFLEILRWVAQQPTRAEARR